VFDPGLLSRLQGRGVEVRRAALSAAAFGVETGSAVGPWIQGALEDTDAGVRAAALEVGARLGSSFVRSAARQVLERDDSIALACCVLAVHGEERDLEHLLSLAKTGRREAVWALGFSGQARAAAALFDLLQDPVLGGLAAEGLQAILGVRLAAAAPPVTPGAVDADAGEEDQEEEVAPPLASQAGAFHWCPPASIGGGRVDGVAAERAVRAWPGRGDTSAQRWLGGAPSSDAALLRALRKEPLRQRHVRALELGARSAGRLQLRTLTWGWRQYRELVGFESAAASSGQ
jgi:hypothetical protein